MKIQLTDDELEAAFAQSPLNELLKPPVVGKIDSPPLELSTGHLALLLASGHLDGLVQPPGEPPHVVRGTARKAEYVKETERTVEKGGDVSNKTVVGEKIELIIRAVDATGVIKTFTQSQQPAPLPQPVVAPAPAPYAALPGRNPNRSRHLSCTLRNPSWWAAVVATSTLTERRVLHDGSRKNSLWAPCP